MKHVAIRFFIWTFKTGLFAWLGVLSQGTAVMRHPLWIGGVLLGLASAWSFAWHTGPPPPTTGAYRRLENPTAVATDALLFASFVQQLSILMSLLFLAAFIAVCDLALRYVRGTGGDVLPCGLPRFRRPETPRVIPGDGTDRAYYDGHCPICRRQTARAQVWCRAAIARGELRLIDFRQQPPAGIPTEELERAIQCVDPRGRVRSGLHGMAWNVLRHSRHWWWAWLYWIPGANWVADPVYTWIATNRPIDCGDATCAVSPAAAATPPPSRR